MAKAFISYSSKDHNFVSLLQRLLQFHYIDVWCGISDIPPGTQFPAEIERAVKDANILLVVVSAQTVSSKWVTKEITTFQTHNSDGLVIPLMLDSTDLDSIVPGLSQYQAINFSKSMLEGYEHLFQLFGKEFLSFRDRRNKPTGRRSSERRQGERRTSPLIQRLRLGFWKAYSTATGRGEFDELSDTLREKLKLIDSLGTEVKKYVFVNDAGQECGSLDVLEESTHRVWNIMKKRGNFFRAIYIVEGVAEELVDQYKILMVVDRRNESRRSDKEKPDRRSK